MTSHYDPDAEPALWQMPDDLWAAWAPLLPPKKLGTPGRPVVPFRQVLDGILYVLRTGCQWKATPTVVGSGSTCHRRFQEWRAYGIFQRLWEAQLGRYDAEYGSGWDWQSADSATVPSPPGRGRDETQSDQPGQTWYQAPRAHRQPWGAPGRGAQWSQPPRHDAGRGHLGQHRGGASLPHCRAAAALVPGQGL